MYGARQAELASMVNRRRWLKGTTNSSVKYEPPSTGEICALQKKERSARAIQKGEICGLAYGCSRQAFDLGGTMEEEEREVVGRGVGASRINIREREKSLR